MLIISKFFLATWHVVQVKNQSLYIFRNVSEKWETFFHNVWRLACAGHNVEIVRKTWLCATRFVSWKMSGLEGSRPKNNRAFRTAKDAYVINTETSVQSFPRLLNRANEHKAARRSKDCEIDRNTRKPTETRPTPCIYATI